MSSSSWSESGDRRLEYRNRIRLARERVDVAAAEDRAQALSARQTPTNSSKLRSPAANSPTRSHHSHTPRERVSPGEPPAGTSRWPLPPSPTATAAPGGRGQAVAVERPPPHLNRPVIDTWFSSSSGSQTPGQADRNSDASVGALSGQGLRPGEHGSPPAHRGDINSFTTDSVYSQPDSSSAEYATTAARSRNSAASHPSHPSSVSSVGDIPEFPIPQLDVHSRPSSLQAPQQTAQPGQQPKRPFISVPPSVARRGASSHYSHQSMISPILEESPGSTPRQRFSLAESLAPTLNPVQERQEPEEEPSRTPLMLDPEMYLAPTDGVRQASIGKKAKASLTLVQTPSHRRKGSSSSASANTVPSAGQIGLAVTSTPSPPDPDSRGLDTGVSTEHGFVFDSNNASTRSISPLTPVVEKILGGLERGGAIAEGAAVPHITEAVNAQHKEQRRSQRLGLKSATGSKRGSTTSLGEMIRRAMRVQTNLDKGRTASRLGMLDMFNRSRDKIPPGYLRHERKTSATDSMESAMIGWMPPQGYGHGGVEDIEGGASGLPDAAAGGEKRARRPRRKSRRGSADSNRKCCGLPQWLFFIILVVIILIIAAAIIVPVELLVVPHQNSQNSNATLNGCASSQPCLNGGQSVIFSHSCSCACVDGFTGGSCGTAPTDSSDPAEACASNDFGAGHSLGNLTLGAAIPRLIVNSTTYLNIPLNSTALAGAFSRAGLSCGEENMLVSFNGMDMRRSVTPEWEEDDVMPSEWEARASAPAPTPAPSLDSAAAIAGGVQRDDLRRDAVSSNAVTSASLILAGPSSTAAAAAAAANGTASASAVGGLPLATVVPPGVGGGGSGSSGLNTTADLDFSRAAVLWILQQTGDMDTAQAAHGQLATLLGSTTPPTSANGGGAGGAPVVVNVADGIEVNLTNGTVTVGALTVGKGMPSWGENDSTQH